MKSILVGNGVNIQFGGKAYTSSFIMKRIKYNALLGNYDSLFNNKIKGEEIVDILNRFVVVTNDILDDRYDCYISDEELLYSLNDFKNRYNKISKFSELMMEDWFLILHIYILYDENLVINDTRDEFYKNVVQGFKQLFLDAIYNHGKLQEIYLGIPEKRKKPFKKFINEFDNIFTLNYDNNLEKLTNKKVYHLHGDFSVLSSSENTENVAGYIRKNNNERVVIKGMEHCYCNALLSYSGYNKLKIAKANYDCMLDSETYKEKYYNNEKFKSDLIEMKSESLDKYELIMTKINHSELKMATEYYFNEFENIEDELHIIGVSPNNDSHIFDCIKQNEKLKRVYFYYHSDWEKEIIENNFSKDLYTAQNVNELWDLLKCTNKKYNVKYDIPNEIDSFIEVFNHLSDDKVSKKDILEEAKNIPKNKAIDVCKIVMEALEDINVDGYLTSEERLEKENNSIAKIALSEGILPSTLYILLTNYYGEIR